MPGTSIPFHAFNKSTEVVFFTGAGISAESGISTFRDPDGHWTKHDPVKLASRQGFRTDPELVLSWYGDRRDKIREIRPNAGHLAITNFQKLFQNSVVITQNVDGLHADAGNEHILELHGNIHKHKCMLCGAPKILTMGEERKLNICGCGGWVRPDVVWFGENLPVDILSKSFEAVRSSHLFFSIGTSTQIYPAAQLPFEAQRNGAYVIEINPESTPFSPVANLSLREGAGNALPKLYEEFYASLS
ncbi:MAG: NAD-dependent deacylase [Candidatus Marinimicrobia bacterium]|nr:NAD-dependent deacylase [Candidatus Neomarinimicrobiota bacterium]